jgi:CheY-like chemotaxis protein
VTEAPASLLVVDDDPINRMVLSRELERQGHRVATADNGAAALEALHAEPFDVVLLDVVMPNLDGLTACALLRQQPETAHIPIVMVTTRGEEANVETAFRNGCTDYVTKPINGVELLTKLSNILGLGGAA